METVGEEESVKLREELQQNFRNGNAVFDPKPRKLQVSLTNEAQNYDYEHLQTKIIKTIKYFVDEDEIMKTILI